MKTEEFYNAAALLAAAARAGLRIEVDLPVFLIVHSIDKTLLDITGQCKECFLNIDVRLGARFQELDAVFIGQGLTLLLADHLLVRHIALITDEDAVDALTRMLLNVPDPISDIVERALIGDVVHQQNAHGAAVIRRCDCPEPFLPRCIPYPIR